MPQGGARGQNLENLRIFLLLFYFFYGFIKINFVFKQQVLFRVDFFSVTLDHRVQCPRDGLGVKIG